MIASRWVMRLVGLISTVVLARLLVPEDFGVVAMAMIVVGLLESLSYAGVDLALIRQKETSRDYYDTAWTVQILQGLFVASVLVAISPLVAHYFGEPRVWAILQFCALVAVISGFQNIGVVAFRKELDFAKEFRFTLYGKLINLVFTITAAVLLKSYWALVAGMLAGVIVNVFISYRMHPYRPRLSLSRVSALWSFSQWLMISQIGGFLNQKTDAIVVGGIQGTHGIGNYHVANDLSTMPTSEFVMPMRRAMFPVLSSIKDDPVAFEAACRTSFAAVATVCLALSFGLAGVADEAIRLILGEKWGDAVPLVRWLALYGGFTSLVLILEMPLWVRGHTRLSAVRTWVELALLVPLAWWATTAYGLEGAAIVRTGVSVAAVLLMTYLVDRAQCIRAKTLALAVWRPFVAAAAMLSGLLAMGTVPQWPVAIVLLLKVVGGGAVFVAILMGLWLLAGRPQGFESDALGKVRTLARRLRPTAG